MRTSGAELSSQPASEIVIGATTTTIGKNKTVNTIGGKLRRCFVF